MQKMKEKIFKMKIKKISKYLIFILLVFVTLNVNADYPSCLVGLARGEKNELTVGDTVTVNLGNDNSATNMFIYKYSYTVRYDSNIFEIVKENNHYIRPSDGWNIISEDITHENTISFVVSTTDKLKMVAGKNNITPNSIASVKFKVKSVTSSSTNISLEYPSNYSYYSSDAPYIEPDYNDEDVINCDISTLTLFFKSDINTLSSIKIDNKEITGYSESKYSYNLTVEGNKDSINIEVTKKDNKSSLSGDIGTKSLNYGNNTFNIYVTSESGVKKTYTLNVLRQDNRSSINTLKTLKLSSGTINFKPDVNEYKVTVKNNVEKVTITSTLTDTKSKYRENFAKKEIELLEGNNKIEITVIAENGKENTYTINITRELSSNNTLKELYINDESIKLHNNAFTYTYNVPNNVESVSIEAIPTDSKADVDIRNISQLEVGENVIDVFVTAQNGDKVSYTIYVVREALISNNSKLRILTVKGYKLNFNQGTNYYNLKIKDEDSLDINAVPEDETAKVEIEGNRNLVNGSIIKINVRAEDNTVTRYFINIEKKKNNSFIWIIILLLLLIGIAVAIIILLKKKKQKEDESINVEPTSIDSEQESNTNEEATVNIQTEEKPLDVTENKDE